MSEKWEQGYPKRYGSYTVRIINERGEERACAFGNTGQEALDRCKHIVHCVNLHDELVNSLDSITNLVESALVHVTHGGPTHEEASEILNRAREVLKKAKEEK
jgi:hypothetical protein